VRPFFFELKPDLEEGVDHVLKKMENGKLEEAATLIDTLFQDHSGYYLVQYAKGCLLSQQGKEAQAIPYFEEAVRIHPYFLEAWANLSLASAKVLKIKRAVEAAREVIDLDQPGSPIYAQAKNLLSGATQVALKHDLSLEKYLKASEIFDQAFDLMGQEDFERAKDGFIKSHALNPKNPSTLGNLGLCYGYLGDKTLALDALDRALKVDPSYEVARINRAKIETLEDGEVISSPFQTINDFTQEDPVIFPER